MMLCLKSRFLTQSVQFENVTVVYHSWKSIRKARYLKASFSFGNRPKAYFCSSQLTSLTVGNDTKAIYPSERTWNIGVIFDSTLK